MMKPVSKKPKFKKLTFQEPESSKYIYIDRYNKVHLLLPITEQTGYAVKYDFDVVGGALAELNSYKEKLKKDIDILKENIKENRKKNPDGKKDQLLLNENLANKILKEKTDRLKQIEAYSNVLKIIKIDESIACKAGNFSQKFCEKIREIILRRNNCLVIRLAPELDLDSSLKFSDPIFSIYRQHEEAPDFGTLLNAFPEFSELINKIFQKIWLLSCNLGFSWDGADVIIRIMSKIFSSAYLLDKKIKDCYDYIFSLKKNLLKINLKNIPKDQTKSSNIFAETAENDDVNTFSILVQFFLAEINLYCFANGLSSRNFGRTFEVRLYSQKIANDVQDALKNKQSVEDALFKIVNDNSRMLGLKRELNDNDKKEIKKRFNSSYKAIYNSIMKDEFIVFTEGKKGNFVYHRYISTHLQDFLDVYKFTRKDKKNLKKSLQLIQYNRDIFSENEGKKLCHINTVVSNTGADKLMKCSGTMSDLIQSAYKGNFEPLAFTLLGNTASRLKAFNGLSPKINEELHKKLGDQNWGAFLEYIINQYSSNIPKNKQNGSAFFQTKSKQFVKPVENKDLKDNGDIFSGNEDSTGASNLVESNIPFMSIKI